MRIKQLHINQWLGISFLLCGVLRAPVALSLSMCAFAVRTASASEKVPAAGTVVTFNHIVDHRTGNQAASCEVSVIVSGDEVADSLAIPRIRVSTAIDDTGSELKLEEPRRLGFTRVSPMDKKIGGFYSVIRLKNPSRATKIIKTLEATAELYHPTTANGGLVLAKNVFQQPGQLVEDEALKKQHIKLMYVTLEQLRAKKEEIVKNFGVTGDLKTACMIGVTRFARVLVDRHGTKDGVSDLQFLLEDPEQRVLDLVVVDDEGNEVKAGGGGSTSSGAIEFYSFLLTGARPASALKVYLDTPDSVTPVPFKLQDITLP